MRCAETLHNNDNVTREKSAHPVRRETAYPGLDDSGEQRPQLFLVVDGLRRTLGRRPRCPFGFGNRHVGAGLGFEEDGTRGQGDNRMENAMRNVDANRLATGLQDDATVNGIFCPKYDNAKTPPNNEQGFILAGIEMAMGRDIRSGLHGNQQAVGWISIPRMKVAIFTPARRQLGLGGQVVEQGPVDQRRHE